MDVKRLVDLAGGIRSLATRVGVSPQTVYDWLRTGFIPGARLPQIAAEMGLSTELLAPLVKPAPVRQAA